MKSSTIAAALAVAMAGSVAAILPTEASAAQTLPAPIKIAAQQRTNISLRGGMTAAESVQRQTEIRTPDAAFIKVHFDHFSLPDGVVLEVSNADGSEVYRYSNSNRDGFTVDKALGQNGVSSFSAMSISGPVARLRLVGQASEPWTSQHGVVVSHYLEGYPEALLPQLQSDGLLQPAAGPNAGTLSICGNDDKRPVACYIDSDPQAFDRSRPVGRMLNSGGGLCTVWRVGSDNRLFTNNHCVSSDAGVAGAEFWFNYQQATCSGNTAQITKVTGDDMLATDYELDYTLFTVNNFAALESFGYLGLDIGAVSVGDTLFIAQHPGGRRKELGVVDDQAGGDMCRVTDAVADGRGNGSDMGYMCDTEGGSSGSPVISRDSSKVIALHHFGGCQNQGVRIAKIWPQVSRFFNGQVPDGDGGPIDPPTDNVLENGVPVENLSADQGNVVEFTMEAPAGAGNLSFQMAGGSGDADLYVRYGSAPTDSSYDCRPYESGNDESCNFANPQAGTWYVRIKAYSSFSGVSLVGSFDAVDDSVQTYQNSNNYDIDDHATVESPVTVSGRSGNAPGDAAVSIDVQHSYIGDLKIDLVAPDGSVYNLHDRSGGSANDVVGSYSLDLSSEPLNGAWKLRVNDNYTYDTGYINGWSVTF